MRLTNEELDEIYDRMIKRRNVKLSPKQSNFFFWIWIIWGLSALIFTFICCANHDYMATKKRIYEENMGIAYEVVDGDTTFFFNIADSVIYQLEYMHKPEKEY